MRLYRFYIKSYSLRFKTFDVNGWKHLGRAFLLSNELLLCSDDCSNQVDEGACRVNWEHAGVAASVKSYSRCIRAQWACFFFFFLWALRVWHEEVRFV